MKQILTAVVFIFCSLCSQAQISFDIDTVYGRDKASEFELIARAKFSNTNVDDGKFVWLRTANSLANSWTSAVCDVEACRDITTDSANFTFAKSVTPGEFTFHFYPHGSGGNGYMIVKVYAESDKNNNTTIVAYGQGWGLGVKTYYNTPYVCYPNPASNLLMINGLGQTEVKTTITSVTGEVITSSSLSESNNSIDVSLLSAGTYFVSFNDGSRTYQQTFIKN